ncbi:hypothetical protein C1Y40_03546 [Mycobacterium talmoniae]|uniref:Uncharacterized protein n=1 Tax=Mycobacterium talmoniae TaxID=1858794 RepID=A0A2S8BHX9_9MYCO|nr:hypothetical protein C1Y40_03546 [Mycobacterium talmoniae]
MRHPTELPSTWVTRLNVTAGDVVVSVYDHGSEVRATSIGAPSRSA